ncbi:c-type cytochrome [Magnetococcales bacterium HHB-1]
MNKLVLTALGFGALLIVIYGGWRIFGTDLEAGARLADNHCGVCHDLTTNMENEKGPPLWGIVDRPAGAMAFPYSESFRTLVNASPFFWDERNLEAFIADPDKFISGSRMTEKKSKHALAFDGVSSSAGRANLISYLKTLK